jgi:peptidoglycan/LPS O-acetylase OafA/YrhL
LATRRQYLALDGLRGLAALAVVAFHVYAADNPALPFSSAYLAVDLFFALSGFVLSHAYDERLAGGLSLQGFMRLRLIRIYPAYLIGLGLGVAGYLLTWPAFSLKKLSEAIVAGLTFAPVTLYLEDAPAAYPLDGPAWSLSFELIATFVFALLYSRLNRATLTIIVLAAALALVEVAIRHGDLNVAWQTAHVWGGLPRVFFPFFVGVLLHRLKPGGVKKLGPVMVLLTMLALALPVPERMHAAYDIGVVMVLFPVTLVGLAGWKPAGVSARAAQLLGKVSYPLYVIHEPCILLLRHVIRNASPADKAIFYGLTVVGLEAVAWLIAEFYEGPVRRALVSMTRFIA